MGAFHISIGGNTVTVPNHFRHEEDVREFLLDKLYKLVTEAQEKRIPMESVSVRFDPHYAWTNEDH